MMMTTSTIVTVITAITMITMKTVINVTDIVYGWNNHKSVLKEYLFIL
jgi:hypothetical protein